MEKNSVLIENLCSYVPIFLLEDIIRNPEIKNYATVDIIPGAVLFADISGFSSLTEKLSAKGPEGVEELTRYLNDYFNQIIKKIRENGGDIIKFAGDALLAFWSENHTYPNIGNLTNRELACLYAAKCAIACNKEFLHIDKAGVHLSLKIAISYGNIHLAKLGGIFGRWEILISGEPLVRLKKAIDYTTKGQTALSGEIIPFIKDYASVETLSSDTYLLKEVRASLETYVIPQLFIADKYEAVIRRYLPAAINKRLAAGQWDWLGELRNLTIIFLNLPDMNEKNPLEKSQELMETIQKVIYKYEGSINKISVDDKGVSILAAFGLPPLTHENDPYRGAQASLDMKKVLSKMKYRFSIGVTSGKVFCGSIGNKFRKEYTVIGDSVNLAARLMQAATHHEKDTDHSILCDYVTFKYSKNRLHFKELEPIHVKGKIDLVKIYFPIQAFFAERLHHDSGSFFGREKEISLLVDFLTNKVKDKNVFLIKGEPGAGKTRLIQELDEIASKENYIYLYGYSDPIEKYNLFFSWKRVFSKIFNIDIQETKENEYKGIYDFFANYHGLLEDISLLNSVFDSENNPISSELDKKNFLEKTIKLLKRALELYSANKKFLVILEDIQDMDTASMNLLVNIVQEKIPFKLILSYRPIEESNLIYKDFKNILENFQVLQLELNNLNKTDTIELIKSMLHLNNVPKLITDLIYNKTQGNPFFTEELLNAMLDSGIVVYSDGELKIRNDKLKNLSFPDTIRGLITSRIDQLSPHQQLVLKSASVIGRTFTSDILNEILPVESDKQHLNDYLVSLEKNDIVPIKATEFETRYMFKNSVTQEVAYNLMLYAQRKELHLKTARAIEKKFADRLSEFYTTLGSHFLHGEEWEKALFYYLNAANEANKMLAHNEARDAYSKALYALSNLSETQDNTRKKIDIIICLANLSFGTENSDVGLERLKESEQVLLSFSPESINEDDISRLSNIYYLIGRAYYFINMPREAFKYYSIAIEEGKKTDKEELIAIPASLIGRVFISQSNHQMAKILLLQALSFLEKTDDYQNWIITQSFYGIALAFTGEINKAEDMALKALEKAKSLNYRSGESVSCICLSLVYYQMGRYEKMVQVSKEGVSSGEKSGDILYVYGNYGLIGVAYTQIGDIAKARESFNSCNEIGKKIGTSLIYQDFFKIKEAELSFIEKNYYQSIELVNLTEDLLEVTQNSLVGGYIKILNALIYEKTKTRKFRTIETLLKDAINNFEIGNNNIEIAKAKLLLSELYKANNMPKKYNQTYELALSMIQEYSLDMDAEMNYIKRILS